LKASASVINNTTPRIRIRLAEHKLNRVTDTLEPEEI